MVRSTLTWHPFYSKGVARPTWTVVIGSLTGIINVNYRVETDVDQLMDILN